MHLCNYMKIKVVEATGVELFRVLTARKLLILQTATTAKRASLPDPLYVYCTKTLFRRCEWQIRQSKCQYATVFAEYEEIQTETVIREIPVSWFWTATPHQQ